LSQYTVDVITNREALTVHDPVASVTLNVLTNAAGTLYIQFDTLKINEDSTLRETSNNGRQHSFQIPLSGVADGAYPFKFGGTRTNPAEELRESPIDTLMIDTVARSTGPIGMSLDETGQVSITYCLSRNIDTQVAMYKDDIKSEFHSVDATQAGTCGPDNKSFAYSAKVPLSVFSQKLNAPAGQGPAGAQSPSGGQAQAKKSQPVSLHIHDKKGTADQNILVLNINAVQIDSSQADTLSKAVQQLTDKTSDSKAKADATATIQAVLTKSGISDDVIKSLIGKLTGGHKDAGQVVASVLLTVLKQAATVYLGIPATAVK
jgi:hypothetical protein